MKKFVFSLEKVLNYKAQIEDSLRNEHATALRDIRIKEDEIENLEQSRQSYMGEYNQSRDGICDPNSLSAYNMYFLRIENKIQEETMKLTALQEIEAECREKVLEAKKERASLEMLKEKKINEYRAAEQKAEELMIEEFVANKAATNR